MSGVRLLANGILYVLVTLIMDLYRSGGDLSINGSEFFGRCAAGAVFAALFEVMSSVLPKVGGRARK